MIFFKDKNSIFCKNILDEGPLNRRYTDIRRINLQNISKIKLFRKMLLKN